MINIRQIILESLERPVITKHEHYIDAEYPHIINHEFTVRHPSITGPIAVNVVHNKKDKLAMVDISGASYWHKNANKLGPSNIRYLSRQIHSHMPDVTAFMGLRVTGAKAGHYNGDKDIAMLKMKDAA